MVEAQVSDKEATKGLPSDELSSEEEMVEAQVSDKEATKGLPSDELSSSQRQVPSAWPQDAACYTVCIAYHPHATPELHVHKDIAAVQELMAAFNRGRPHAFHPLEVASRSHLLRDFRGHVNHPQIRKRAIFFVFWTGRASFHHPRFLSPACPISYHVIPPQKILASSNAR
jgi:hypothetical protein